MRRTKSETKRLSWEVQSVDLKNMTRNETEGDTLIMRSPAAWHRDMYREAAPAGNGLIGSLVYGGIKIGRAHV